MLAGMYSPNAGDQALCHGMAANTVAASEHSKRAERVEHCTMPAQDFSAQRQTRPHRCFQTMRQGVQMRPQPLPTCTRVQADKGLIESL